MRNRTIARFSNPVHMGALRSVSRFFRFAPGTLVWLRFRLKPVNPTVSSL